MSEPSSVDSNGGRKIRSDEGADHVKDLLKRGPT